MLEVDLVPLRAEKFPDREREAIAICRMRTGRCLACSGAYARTVSRSRAPTTTTTRSLGRQRARIERQAILRGREAPLTCFAIGKSSP
jgi:hypothetical protein